MAWGRIDDKLYSHRKTMRIPRDRRCEAMGLWALCDSWCNSHGTDGNVPRDILDEFGTTPDVAQLLVDAGYWSITEEGYQFVNWGDFNLTSDDLEAKRSAEAERKRKWREAKKAKSGGSPVNVPVGQDGTVPDVPDSPAMSPLTHTQSHTQKNSSTKSSLAGADSSEPGGSVTPLPTGRKRPSTKLPEDWRPNSKHREIANAKGLDLEAEARKFRFHAEEKDRRAVVWNSAFSRWLENAHPRAVNSGSDRGRLWQD